MADVSNPVSAIHGTPAARRCPDSRHCAPIERFVRRTGVDLSTAGRYAWLHIGPIGALASLVSVHWSDDDEPLDSRVMATHRAHKLFTGLSLDLLGLTERPHAQARRMTFTIDGAELSLFVIAQYAWRDVDGLVASWYAHPDGRRISRESDEHALTKDERALMMQLEDLLLGHGRTGRKPRDADAIDAAEVDTWLAARREIPQPRWRDLADRYHRNEDTIRKRCAERERELERERSAQVRTALSPVNDVTAPRPLRWVTGVQFETPAQPGRMLRTCQRG